MDNKDLLCYDFHNNANVENVLILDNPAENTESYAYVKSEYKLSEGEYMLYRRGSTMRIFGFSWTSSGNTAVEDIEADVNAPVVYYNLQGVQVENPENGIFIRKQGAKTTKVVI